MANHSEKSGIGFDAILTPKNYLSSFKRVAHCLKKKKEVVIGMTLKNEELYARLKKDLKIFGINIRIKSQSKYMVGEYIGICKVVFDNSKTK